MTRPGAAVAAVILLLWLPGAVAAQQSGWIEGEVRDPAGNALAGATVTAPGIDAPGMTDAAGTFLLGPLPAGQIEVRISLLGYANAEEPVTVIAGDTVQLQIDLATRPIELTGVDVSVLLPDLSPQAGLQEREVREANPRDVGELLRALPGMGSVRRGPVGLDPVVRGLRETEVGVYLDGTRIFPGGAARMDSPLSHLDPSALSSIEVIKGPYALTWGAGNMSAIRVETQQVPPPVAGAFHGRILSGYDSNLNAREGAASVFGSRGRLSYWVHSVWRDGDDYESGTGTAVPGNFLSRELRGKVGYEVAPGSRLTLSAGYQDQNDIDYPGRLLDASFFNTFNLAAGWALERSTGLLRSLEALAYVNDVDHGMDNDDKPTAQADSARMPPFPLQVEVSSGVNVVGGRLAGTFAPGPGWTLELGGDAYRADRSATRQIRRRDMDMLMFEDLMWPDATITDVGLFARVSPALTDRISAAATMRLDVVRSEADTASEFFLENVSRELDASETNVSAAVTATALLSQNWSASVGVGSAVRTADATERYSDRIAASKAQTSAEFMGNPALKPERSTQADVWLQASYPRISLHLNAFARRIDDYITLEATALPKRLPLSPETVFQYVNGEATYWGAEASASYVLTEPLTLSVTGSYLRGRDKELDEPALGVPPLNSDVALRYEPADAGFFVEGSLHLAADQEQVAARRGELPTSGYTTLDLSGGVELSPGLLLRLGANNLTDKNYANHLNAKNPFTGAQLPEPGRTFFARLNYAF